VSWIHRSSISPFNSTLLLCPLTWEAEPPCRTHTLSY
jgi:hypothetical protein